MTARKPRWRRLAVWGAVGAVTLLAGAAMLDRWFIAIPGLIQEIRNPVGPSQPVSWQEGPAQGRDPGVAEAAGLVGRRPPNIVLIVADDLGWNDITLHGGVAGGTVPTPNIDRLAREGARLTNAYAASGTCAPSRAALMTGRYPTRFGFEFTPTPPGMGLVIRHLDRRQSHRRPFLIHKLGNGPGFDAMAMPPGEITVAELLRARGYQTVHVGKWHLGGTAGSDPRGQGFDESLELAGLLHAPAGAAGIVDARQAFDPIDQVNWAIGRAAVMHNGSRPFRPEGYLTDYFTQKAVEAIHANRSRPFFLYLAHWAPHAPLQATQEDYETLGHIRHHPTRVYAAMIRALDRGVGAVMAALKAEGLDDNTLVIFTSDNGGAHYIGLPEINRPWRGWKATFFGGGIRVPIFVRWPAVVAPGTTLDGLSQHIDITPTIAAAAGAPLPPDRTVDGRDLIPFLTGRTGGSPHETLFWRSGHYQAVIHQGWKLQRAGRPARTWLFDLTRDPQERKDLSAAEPGRVARLTALLAAHDATQATPLWPSAAEMPVSIDKPLGVPENPEDEYVYWPN